jgi:hypothetical protein
MEVFATRRPRLRVFARGLVAWSYLPIGLLVVPMMVDLLLNEFGLISGSILPFPPELGGWLLGVLIFLGWPFAIAIAWYFRRDRVVALPAVLFLGAELIFAIVYWVWPTSGAMLALSGIAGAVFGVSAIRAWVLWIRNRA